MFDFISYFIMVPMVYLAFAALIFGIIFKLVIVFRSTDITGTLGTFPRGSSAMAEAITEALTVPVAFKKAKVLWFFTIVFHAAFVLLFLGHIELICDFQTLQLIPHRVFLGAGAVGIILVISVLYFLLRRFKTPYREISVPEDYLILLLLFLTFFFGSHLHLADRYGIGAIQIPIEEYRIYLGSLVQCHPRLPVMITSSAHFIILLLHLFFANLFLMLFPFSKMIHSVFVFFALYIKRK